MAGMRDYNEYTRIEWNYNEPIYYDCYDMSGHIKYMRGHDNAMAIFGQFEVAFDENSGRKILRWTVLLGSESDRRKGREDNWVACHESSNGEFLDDLLRLKAGQVDWF